jgi:hypothetical protein
MEMIAETNNLRNEMHSEYLNRYHVEANQIYEELCVRLKEEPFKPGFPPSRDEGYTQMMDYAGISEMITGNLAGARPLTLAANKIDRMAASL